MVSSVRKISPENFSFSSCIKSDVWHPEKDPRGYEWWYFDALSDDGKEAVVIIFLDNFVFSPRYNSFGGGNENGSKKQFPALAFIYYRNGKPVYRAINEFSAADFDADPKNPRCRIGDSLFHLESASYGSGYVLEIDVNLYKDRRLKAKFEWLSIESDLRPLTGEVPQNSHFWNLVSPRSDVTGKVTVTNRKGTELDVINFRGTGYHDHNYDNRWMPETVSEWQWGRAHFTDATAVFYRYHEIDDDDLSSRLFLIRDNQLIEKDAEYEVGETGRDKFGLRYPKLLRFGHDDSFNLLVRQNQIIDSSFFYLRFLSELTLTLPGGETRKTTGITEHLKPKSLKYRWLDWLVNMRIGKDGKSPFLP